MAENQNTTFREIPKGFCQCGCGRKTSIAKCTFKPFGFVKGEPVRFIHGHNRRGIPNPNVAKYGEKNPRWNGGKSMRSTGYLYISDPHNPMATKQGYVFEHRIIAGKALGKPIPEKAQVHHHGPISDNCLVICQDNAYHHFLHQRTRAYNACGNPTWRKCQFCKKWDDPANLHVNKRHSYHNSCANTYNKGRVKNLKHID